MRWFTHSLVLVALLALGMISAHAVDCRTSGFNCMNLDTQIKGSRLPMWGVDAGTANAYSITTIAPLGPSLRTGSRFAFIATHANTTASTLAVNGGSTIAIKKNVSAALASGDIGLNQVVEVTYDGTNFQLVGPGLIATSITINGVTCTLGSSCTVTGAPSGSAGGDLTGTYPNPTLAAILTSGSCGDATHSCGLTYDAKGRITAATNNVISGGGGGGGSANTPYATPVAASPAITYNGMAYWFSADCIYQSDGSTCTMPSNGTDITIWWDRSGMLIFAEENATGCTLTSTVAAINNQPAIAFNGTCGKYGMFDFVSQNVTWNTVGFTIFAVVQNTLTSGSGAIVGGLTAGDVEYRMNTGSNSQELLRENTQSLGTDSQAHDTNWHQINVTCGVGALANSGANTTPQFRIDRAASSTAGGNACSGYVSGTSAMTRLGYNAASNSEIFKGNIAEIIMYRRVLSSSEISAVESYLNTKYGI